MSLPSLAGGLDGSCRAHVHVSKSKYPDDQCKREPLQRHAQDRKTIQRDRQSSQFPRRKRRIHECKQKTRTSRNGTTYHVPPLNGRNRNTQHRAQYNHEALTKQVLNTNHHQDTLIQEQPRAHVRAYSNRTNHLQNATQRSNHRPQSKQRSHQKCLHISQQHNHNYRLRLPQATHRLEHHENY